MRRILLPLAFASVCIAANAQQTYNYFDPADCDADGWLWLNTEAKLNKYCGFPSDGKFKIYLESTTFMDANMSYAEPYLDATVKGYNEAGVEGGEGSWTGGIVLPEASAGIGSIPADGGGILLNLPDCAEYSLALSTENSYILTGVEMANGMDAAVIDLKNIKAWMKIGILSQPLASVSQYKWLNIQDIVGVTDEAKGYTIGGQNHPTTSVVRNNTKNAPLLIQGIKIFTYTDTNSGTGAVGDIIGENENAPVEYYNLQGMKVSGDQPGLYIRRQGTKSEKVVVK